MGPAWPKRCVKAQSVALALALGNMGEVGARRQDIERAAPRWNRWIVAARAARSRDSKALQTKDRLALVSFGFYQNLTGQLQRLAFGRQVLAHMAPLVSPLQPVVVVATLLTH